MIEGKNTFIRLMEEEDVPHKVDWFNDIKVRKTLNVNFPISIIGTKKWLNNVSLNDSRKDFIICSSLDNVPVGYCGLVNIDIKNSKAESYLGMGNKEYWGKGHASEARRLLLDYAFNELDLNKVYSYVWSANEKMIHINKKVGYQVEGKLRDDVFHQGEFRDKLIMGLLKKEYRR